MAREKGPMHNVLIDTSTMEESRERAGSGMYMPKNAKLTGLTTGNALVKDPETGFLTASGSGKGNPLFHFTPLKKLEFLELCSQHWPNIHRVCLDVKVSYATYKNHLIMDEKFAECMEEIKQAKVDNVEGNVFTFSQRPQNFMDRMAILRAYRGELYNPVQKVEHSSGNLSKDDVARRRVGLTTVLDAELVNVSAQVLEAEVLPSLAANLVPDVEQVPVQTPSGEPARENDPSGGVLISALRDPLLDMEA